MCHPVGLPMLDLVVVRSASHQHVHDGCKRFEVRLFFKCVRVLQYFDRLQWLPDAVESSSRVASVDRSLGSAWKQSCSLLSAAMPSPSSPRSR